MGEKNRIESDDASTFPHPFPVRYDRALISVGKAMSRLGPAAHGGAAASRKVNERNLAVVLSTE